MVAVVTGGTKGIGLGIAECLLRRGHSVAVTYLKDSGAADRAKQRLSSILKGESGILVLQGDAGDPGVVASHYREVSERLGPVGILVNNAGIMTRRSFGEIDLADWEHTLNANLSSAFYWTSRVVPDMEAMGFGRIVNISSIAARGGGVIGAHYAASKAGMLGLTKYLARELGPKGITVNAIAPAFIEDAGVFVSWSEEEKATLLQKIFVPRLGRVEDVVRAFEFFLDSPFVTGVTIDVNGGAFIA